MKIALDVVAAWTALDVVLLVAWCLAHAHARHAGASRSPARPSRAVQVVYTFAPGAMEGERESALAAALQAA
jgi:hypothetical protein